jgi:hypothetical protein
MGFLDRWIREWIGSAAKPVEKRAFTLNWIKPQDRRGEEAREGGRSGNHSTGRAVEKSCQGQRRAQGESKKRQKNPIPVQGEGGLGKWRVQCAPPRQPIVGGDDSATHDEGGQRRQRGHAALPSPSYGSGWDRGVIRSSAGTRSKPQDTRLGENQKRRRRSRDPSYCKGSVERLSGGGLRESALESPAKGDHILSCGGAG